MVSTDQKRIQQIFLNIFSNAVKFTDRGGNIVILVEYQVKPVDGQLQKFLRVSITDSGIGIKKKNKKKLFKMFGSIKDEKKKINTNGIGLGLVISKLIVNKFGGIIDFIS
jgi:signal transduction histidine kinase